MNIPRPLKLALLALTIWPLVYIVGFMFILPYVTVASFDMLFAVHAGTMLLSLGLYAVYTVDLFKTKRVPRDVKALWGVALLIGSYVTMLVYWAKHIWPESTWAIASVVTTEPTTGGVNRTDISE